MSDDLEGSKGGDRSVLTVGIVAACLFVLIVLVGLGAFGSKSVAPNTPQQNAESPATSGAQKP
jgi:hypothetical protein